MDRDSALDTVADELYALPPQDFTGVRNTRAKEAKSAGDRDLAAGIAALRRPSTSAWAVNLLARERADLIEQLLELADALRSAQETLSGPELRTLSTQRHRVIASMVGEARKLASAQGTKVSDSVERELEATFEAALADPQAAAEVRAGRLSTSLSYAGLGAAPAEGALQPPPPKAQKAQQVSKAERREDGERQREEARRAAEQTVTEAERDLRTAEAERDSAIAAHERAETERDEAQQRVADLTARLEQAQADAVAGANAVREQHRASSRAEHRAQEAQRRLDRAREALAKLS